MWFDDLLDKKDRSGTPAGAPTLDEILRQRRREVLRSHVRALARRALGWGSTRR